MMAGPELEALVGHLFVFGGRSISSASPGAVAMPAPRRAARGRDNDTFFGLLALYENQRRPASFYEELSEAVASEYFKTSGSATSALRKAIDTLNTLAVRLNASSDDPVDVGLICAVLRAQELLVAAVGPSRCFLLREGLIERLPTDEEFAEGVTPLGHYSDIDVRYYRREVHDGDFLILTDLSLSKLTDDTLSHAASSGEIELTLNNLAAVSGDYTTAQVIKFVSPLAEVEPAPESAAQEEPAGATPAAPPAHTTTERPRRRERRSPDGAQAIRQAGYGLIMGIAGALGRVRTLLERMLPGDDEESLQEDRWQVSPTLQFGIAISVAVLVALVTTGVYRLRGQTSQYAQLVREAQSEIEQARAATGDQAQARPHWETAIFLLDQAAEIRSLSGEVLDLQTEALDAVDAFDAVTRVAPALMREYEPGAYLRGPIVNGLNLYVIDTTADILYREDLDQSGVQLVNRDPQIITRQGDQISTQVVGGLIDLIWMEDGGVPQRNVLAVVTRNGLLVTYSPSWDVTAVVLPGFEAWQDPRAVAVYNRDLYILDAGANEIWRYQAAESSYPNTPQRYFTDVLPELSDAVDMQIDTNGNIYVLHTGGRISKYFFGRPEPYDLQGLPQPLTRPTALFLNLSLFDRSLLIADPGSPGGGSLYSTSLTGTFLANYKGSDSAVFNALSGAYNQDNPPYIYVTSGNRLYYFSRPQ